MRDRLEEQIIFLDRFDEVASIRTKLETARGGYAALVVPVENHSLHSPIAVRLIVRQAESLALRLGVISSDATVRRLFRDEGLPAFRTVKAYREWVARQSAPFTRLSSILNAVRVRFDRTAGALVLILIVALGGAMVYVLLPSTTVTISPVTEPVSEAIVLKADPAIKAINIEAKQIPARAVNIPLEGSIQVPTTGKKPMPNARAVGQVTLTNRTTSPIVVRSGTIVKTPDNVRFVIVQETTLAPGATSTKIDIVAVDPGAQANVERGRISKAEDILDQQLAVFNEEPTIGGGASEIPIVTAEDREKARAGLVEKMRRDALTKLEEQRQQGESLPPHSVSFVVLEETYDKKEGDQARVLNLNISGRASGTLFNGQDVNEFIRRAWQPKVREGYFIPADGYQVFPPEIVKAEAGAVTFIVRVEGVAVAQANETRIQENVRWKTADEAKKYLMQTFSLAKEPKVTIDPGWASRALRVRVVIETDWTKN